MSVQTDYHVVNRTGLLLLATPCRDIALKRAKEQALHQEGVEVREIIITTTDRRVYRPAPKLEVVR